MLKKEWICDACGNSEKTVGKKVSTFNVDMKEKEFCGGCTTQIMDTVSGLKGIITKKRGATDSGYDAPQARKVNW
jgi:hypothetical protein